MFGKKKKIEDELSVDEIREFEEDEETKVKPKKKKLPGWVIIPILAVIVLAAIGISKLAGTKSGPMPLQVVSVKKGDVKEIYNTSGVVQSEREKVFFSPVTAPVASCSAKLGSVVKAGDMLVTYDLKDLEKNNTETQLNLQSTQATNQSLREQASKAASSAQQAQAEAVNQLNSQISALEQNLADARVQAQNAWAAAETESAGIQAENAKINETKENNRIIEEEIAKNEMEIQALEAEQQSAENENRNFEAVHKDETEEQKAQRKQELVAILVNNPIKIFNLQSNNTEKRAKIIAVGDAVNDSPAVAAALAADQQVASLEASLNEVRNQNAGSGAIDSGITGGQQKSMNIAENLAELSLLSVEELMQKGRDGIKAEFDGIISDVKVTEGVSAAQGVELFTIVSNQSVALKLEVPSNDFDKLVLGNKAVITVGQNTYNGTLSEIDKIALANAKGNPVVGVKIHIDNPNDEIVIGVSAKAKVHVAEAKNVLMVSNELVNTETSGDFVYVIKNGIVKKQTVELGIASNNEVEVKRGLKEGDKVVSDATSDIKEGMQATAMEIKSSK